MKNRPLTDLLLVKNGPMATKVKVSENKHYKGIGFLNTPPPGSLCLKKRHVEKGYMITLVCPGEIS